MNAILTIDQYRNEQRMRRLRTHYTHALTQREHTELIERGEAIRREWGTMPIPQHRALISVAEVQSAAVATSPSDAPTRSPRLPVSGQQALIPTPRARRRAKDSRQ